MSAHRHRPKLLVTSWFFALLFVSALAVRFGRADMAELSYRNLGLTHSVDRDSPERASDTPSLTDVNEDAIGWLEVEGTDTSYPVVQVPRDKPRTWYLTHDFWGDANEGGCPYLDTRSSPDGLHLMIYGHHIVGTDRMFGELADAYRQETFDRLGSATWKRPSRRSTRFLPLFAMRVDASFQPIQSFSFQGQTDLRRWLSRLKAQANALTPDSVKLIDSADTVMTLVTCTGPYAGMGWRTLVVFIEVDKDQSS